jgi:hypothetical protein
VLACGAALTCCWHGVASAVRVAAACPHAPLRICRIAEYQQERARRLEEVRNAQQYCELAPCTFAPEINSSRRAGGADAPPPPPVRGLDAYLEKQRLAKKKAEDEEKRREEVFKVHPKSPKAKYTVAEPFKLSLDKRVRRTAPPHLACRL